MSLHAWRSVHPTQAWAHAAQEAAVHDGAFHRAGDRVVYAWNRSELAAMCTAYLCAGVDPDEMLWEKLQLPGTEQIGFVERGSPDLLQHLRRHRLLGTWVATPLAEDGMVLVLNPEHPGFAQIRVVDSRFIARDMRRRHD